MMMIDGNDDNDSYQVAPFTNSERYQFLSHSSLFTLHSGLINKQCVQCNEGENRQELCATLDRGL